MGTQINCIKIYNKRKGVNTLSDKGKGKEEGECINPQVMRACAILQVLLLEELEKNHKKYLAVIQKPRNHCHRLRMMVIARAKYITSYQRGKNRVADIGRRSKVKCC